MTNLPFNNGIFHSYDGSFLLASPPLVRGVSPETWCVCATCRAPISPEFLISTGGTLHPIPLSRRFTGNPVCARTGSHRKFDPTNQSLVLPSCASWTLRSCPCSSPPSSTEICLEIPPNLSFTGNVVCPSGRPVVDIRRRRDLVAAFFLDWSW